MTVSTANLFEKFKTAFYIGSKLDRSKTRISRQFVFIRNKKYRPDMLIAQNVVRYVSNSSWIRTRTNKNTYQTIIIVFETVIPFFILYAFCTESSFGFSIDILMLYCIQHLHTFNCLPTILCPSFFIMSKCFVRTKNRAVLKLITQLLTDAVIQEVFRQIDVCQISKKL